MGWSSKSGRARTSLTSPDAFAVCDLSGIWDNHSRMSWQYQWAGNQLVNLKLLVCDEYKDVPNEQLRNLVLPPDPIPTKDPRLEPFNYDANPSTVVNWDTPGANWDTPGGQWDNQILGTSEVPD